MKENKTKINEQEIITRQKKRVGGKSDCRLYRNKRSSRKRQENTEMFAEFKKGPVTRH